MKQSYCTAKEFFVIKASLLLWNATKRIKQILDAEYKKINQKTINMSLNCLKNKHNNSLFELLPTYEKMFGWILGKYTDSDYNI